MKKHVFFPTFFCNKPCYAFFWVPSETFLDQIFEVFVNINRNSKFFIMSCSTNVPEKFSIILKDLIDIISMRLFEWEFA